MTKISIITICLAVCGIANAGELANYNARSALIATNTMAQKCLQEVLASPQHQINIAAGYSVVGGVSIIKNSIVLKYSAPDRSVAELSYSCN